MGFLGIIQNDIKRVVAYSTLSQLGYMTVALGASAYSVAVFHLMTHAFFKALLFLAAGSVIIGMHHDQDIRNMGGLRKYMPHHLDHLAARLAGADRHAVLRRLLLQGQHHRGGALQPPAGLGLRLLRGDGRRVRHRVLLASACTSWCSTGRSASATSPSRASTTTPTTHGHVHVHEPHESPWVVTVPLVLLAIPSVVHRLPDDRSRCCSATSSRTRSSSTPRATRRWRSWPRTSTAPGAMALHGLTHAAVLAGAGRRGRGLVRCTSEARRCRRRSSARFAFIYRVLDNKYYLDWFNENVLAAAGARHGPRPVEGRRRGGDRRR